MCVNFSKVWPWKQRNEVVARKEQEVKGDCLIVCKLMEMAQWRELCDAGEKRVNEGGRNQVESRAHWLWVQGWTIQDYRTEVSKEKLTRWHLCRHNSGKTQELTSDGFCFLSVGGQGISRSEQSCQPGKHGKSVGGSRLSRTKMRLVCLCSDIKDRPLLRYKDRQVGKLRSTWVRRLSLECNKGRWGRGSGGASGMDPGSGMGREQAEGDKADMGAAR